MGIFDSYDVETNDGLLNVRPLDRLVRESESIGGKVRCPRCGLMASLFFGDSDFDFDTAKDSPLDPKAPTWCYFCQMAKELDDLPSG